MNKILQRNFKNKSPQKVTLTKNRAGSAMPFLQKGTR